MSDLIKREDAIHILVCVLYAEAQQRGEDAKMGDFIPEAKAWMADAPSAVECYVNGQMVVRGVPDGYLRDDIEGVIVYSDSFCKCFEVVRSKRKGGDDE